MTDWNCGWEDSRWIFGGLGLVGSCLSGVSIMPVEFEPILGNEFSLPAFRNALLGSAIGPSYVVVYRTITATIMLVSASQLFSLHSFTWIFVRNSLWISPEYPTMHYLAWSITSRHHTIRHLVSVRFRIARPRYIFYVPLLNQTKPGLHERNQKIPPKKSMELYGEIGYWLGGCVVLTCKIL